MVDRSIYAAARLEEVQTNLHNLGLSVSYLHSFMHNPSRDLPYHGDQHQLAVAILSYRGGLCHQHELTKDERRALYIAALFHDWGYDPALDEPTNIAVAMAQGRWATAQFGDQRLSELVATLISETAVPHSAPTSIAAALLQDADLLMISQPDSKEFLRGLAEEQPSSIADPLFPGAAALNTEWAKRIYATAVELREKDELILDPKQAIIVGNTQHAQTLCSQGFLVDSSIADGLEALWAAGFKTVFSCGGDSGAASPGYHTPLDGYIAFVGTSRAQKRTLRAAAKSIGRKVEHFESDLGFTADVVRFKSMDARELFAALL